jgi:hypothetical protein
MKITLAPGTLNFKAKPRGTVLLYKADGKSQQDGETAFKHADK